MPVSLKVVKCSFCSKTFSQEKESLSIQECISHEAQCNDTQEWCYFKFKKQYQGGSSEFFIHAKGNQLSEGLLEWVGDAHWDAGGMCYGYDIEAELCDISEVDFKKLLLVPAHFF